VTAAAGPPVARRVAANTAVQLAGKAAVMAIGLASVAVTTRYLGASDYGKLALALVFVQTFGLLADVGLLTVAVREMSRTPERTNQLVGAVLALRLALSLAVVPLAALASLALPYDREVRLAILIAGGSLVLGLANGALVAVFQSRLRMGRAAVSEVLGRACAFAALAAVAALDLGFYAVVATAAVGAAVALAASWILVRPLATPRLRARRDTWRPLLMAALPVGAALAVTEVYFRADTFIISLFRDYDEVGAYSLAYRVIELLAVLPAVVMTSVFPLLSSYLGDDRDRDRDRAAAIDAASPGDRDRAAATIDAVGDVFLAIGVPLAAGGLVVAPQVVELVAGDGFGDAADPLRILLFAGALAAVSGLLGYALIAGGRQASALRLALVALAANVALNLALVPPLGIEAAAAVTVASEVLMVAGGLWLVRRELDLRPRFAIAWRVVLAAAVMAGVLALMPADSLAVLLPLGVVLYGAVLFAVGGVDRSALEALRP
jgi:O-antigen/teichoic acid export membrane protein